MILACVLSPVIAQGQSLDPQEITEKTDEELTELTARWGELSAAERRTVLHEVRNRMRASANASAQAKANVNNQISTEGRSGIIVQRRYGRKSDGSVVVQTRVIQKGAPTRGRVTFGFGFERRAKNIQPEQPTQVVKGEGIPQGNPEGTPVDQ